MSVCLSVCLSVRLFRFCLSAATRKLQSSPQNLVPSRSRRGRVSARIDSGYTYRLGQLSDSMEPCALSYVTQPHRGAIACRQIVVPESVREVISVTNWLQPIDRNKSGTTLYKHGSLSAVVKRKALTRLLPAARKRPCKVASGCKVLTPCGLQYIMWPFPAGSLASLQSIGAIIKHAKTAPANHQHTTSYPVIFPYSIPGIHQTVS